MIEATLFNINDVSLLFSGFLAIVLAFLLFFARMQGRLEKTYGFFLIAFFLLFGLRSLDALIYWNISLRDFVSYTAVDSFFVLGIVLFLQGPVLLWGCKSLFNSGFKLHKKDSLHLLPAFIYPLYVYFTFHPLLPDQKVVLAQDWAKLLDNSYCKLLYCVQRVALICYSSYCLYFLGKCRCQLSSDQDKFKVARLPWLKLLLGGFLIINGSILLLLVIEVPMSSSDSQLPLVFESYAGWLLLSLLLVFLLKAGDVRNHASNIGATPSDTDDVPDTVDPPQHLAAKLIEYMEVNKPYLEPHITVERLANRLNVSPKLLSYTINSQLNMNFFELIGSYRVAEAKKRLADAELSGQPIAEIMKSCGFNSKSVFNQAFKKAVGVTPSHYRQQQIN